jgi:hypothetical protein
MQAVYLEFSIVAVVLSLLENCGEGTGEPRRSIP